MTTASPSGPGIDVAAVARRCLDGVVAVYDDRGWPLPVARYVAAGTVSDQPVYDEHLCVCLLGLYPGPTEYSARPGTIQSKGLRARGLPYGTFVVRLMRSVPTGDDQAPPTPDELHASGLELLADPGRLYRALVAWRDTESGPTANALITVGQVEPVGPEGDMAGHQAYFTISPVQ